MEHLVDDIEKFINHFVKKYDSNTSLTLKQIIRKGLQEYDYKLSTYIQNDNRTLFMNSRYTKVDIAIIEDNKIKFLPHKKETTILELYQNLKKDILANMIKDLENDKALYEKKANEINKRIAYISKKI